MACYFLFILFSVTFFLEQGDAKIITPCKLKDYKCITDNLAANSRCNPDVKGVVKEDYVIPKFHFATPFFNSSYIDTDLHVRNQHSCVVSQFFFNTNSGRVVLAIDCPKLVIESERTYIQHMTYKEDSYYQYHIHAVYPLIRITINLPPGNMNMCAASVFADVATLPELKIDPKDKHTAKALTKDLTLLNIYERENFHFRGRPLAFMFINSMLCNFTCAPCH